MLTECGFFRLREAGQRDVYQAGYQPKQAVQPAGKLILVCISWLGIPSCCTCHQGCPGHLSKDVAQAKQGAVRQASMRRSCEILFP